MYLFNRTIETTGEMAKIIPILHDVKKAGLAAGVDYTIWIGGNGYKNGTVIFSANYATLADRAAATAKLGASKAMVEVNQKIIPYINAVKLILTHIKDHYSKGNINSNV
jgi:hypothetical protein